MKQETIEKWGRRMLTLWVVSLTTWSLLFAALVIVGWGAILHAMIFAPTSLVGVGGWLMVAGIGLVLSDTDAWGWLKKKAGL